jgi:site-specific DNA-methyltransferase (adenine-specific)
VKILYADDPTGDDMPFDQYMQFTREWMAEAKRVLVPGGRLCINVGNTGRDPYIPLNTYIVRVALDELHLLMRQEFIWYKGDAIARKSTGWGSWKSASNPVIRDCHEYVEIFSKDTYFLDVSEFPPSNITSTQNADYTIGLRQITPDGRKHGHPATFPDALVAQFVQLYTHPGMVVLDPFSGSGTTFRVARSLGRNALAFDRSPTYVELSRKTLGGNLFA